MQRAETSGDSITSDAFGYLDEFLKSSVPDLFPAGVVLVERAGETLFHQAYGFLDPTQNRNPTQSDTLFDLASVTKLFTAVLFMRLVEQGRVSLETPVRQVIPEFSGQRSIGPREDPLSGAWLPADSRFAGQQVALDQITFRHLLTHTSGLTPWCSIYRVSPEIREVPLPHQVSPTTRAHRVAAVSACDFTYPTGERILYSDLGFILLGEAVARLSGVGLEMVLQETLLRPLGLGRTCYNPLEKNIPASEIAPTGMCAWRKRKLLGEVNDENAASLGGVAGHAGLFSTTRDVAQLGRIFLLESGLPGGSLLQPETVAEMTREQASRDGLRRGLAWVLWTPQDCACGSSFSRLSFGHTGFTGTSLWIDPVKELMVVVLTNRVYNGRNNLAGIQAFRPRLHDLVYAVS